MARYLSGPLACETTTRMRQRHGQSFEQIVLGTPVSAVIEMNRRPEVSADAGDLIRRLPYGAAEGLDERLARCTARLDIHDGPGARRLVPANRVARSVLVPLAFAMGGIVEEVDSGRLLYFALPEPGRRPLPQAALGVLVSGLDRLLGLLALRPWGERPALPGPALSARRLPSPSPSPGPQALLPAPQARQGSR
ncbi:hypothetical protein [Rhodovulum sp. ES.010]|uniref:hypothetical protein n=1 Tax=Rhodovulum sp. ES.010 TaxID=1882821 RepID=UPI0011151208|nr:hypothetical protein [Rhodovulum sp. ES.010]